MTQINNAEIHIVRVDPSRYNGQPGFIWAVTGGKRYYKSKKGVLYVLRADAAAAAVSFINKLEYDARMKARKEEKRG